MSMTEVRPAKTPRKPAKKPAGRTTTKAGAAASSAPAEPPKAPTKVKVSLTLDADIVAAFERSGPLSAQINEALRAEADHRLHMIALDELIARYEAEEGPLDTPEDLAAIRRYMELLS